MKLPDFGGIIGGGDVKKILDMIGNNDNDKIVVKEIPVKKEWSKMFKDLRKMKEESVKMDRACEAERKKIWAIIELDMNDFDSDKAYNIKKDVIEIMGDKPESKGIESPFKIGIK